MNEGTKTSKYRKVWSQLDNDYNSWKSHYQDIVDYMQPRKGRYLAGDEDYQNQGKKKHQKVINGLPEKAIKILTAGMQGGMTSPSRPWFTLALPDEDLMEFGPVRDWLHNVRNIMLNVFAKSNFYGSIHSQYMELAAFGTSAMLIEEDDKKVIRCRPFTIGEYRLALDSRYRVNRLYRKFSMSVSQMVEKFGIDKVSEQIKSVYKNNQGEKRFEVIHAIQPNKSVRQGALGPEGMAYESVYFEDGSDPDKVLRRSGYVTVPFVAPRWEVTAVDTYGNSPGMEALGDVKMLQKMEEKKLKALDKMVDPPMNADTALKKQGGTVISGGVNYIDGFSQGQKGFAPAYQVNPDMQNIAFEIDRVEHRVRGYFFNDLFLALLGTDKTMTATEVAQRHEEKLLMLGPVLERLQAELLDVIIERTYNICSRQGILPEAPNEIKGADLKIEYISTLAQAQKMVGITSIEQTAAFIGSLVSVNPEVADKFDFDEAVDQYKDMVGLPPKIVRSDDKVAEIREVRAKQQQQMQNQEMALQMVDGAKTMSDTKLNQGTALDMLMGGI